MSIIVARANNVLKNQGYGSHLKDIGLFDTSGNNTITKKNVRFLFSPTATAFTPEGSGKGVLFRAGSMFVGGEDLE